MDQLRDRFGWVALESFANHHIMHRDFYEMVKHSEFKSPNREHIDIHQWWNEVSHYGNKPVTLEEASNAISMGKTHNRKMSSGSSGVGERRTVGKIHYYGATLSKKRRPGSPSMASSSLLSLSAVTIKSTYKQVDGGMDRWW